VDGDGGVRETQHHGTQRLVFPSKDIDEAFRDVIAVLVVPIEHGSSRALQPLPGAPVTPCLQLRIGGVT
jgi:hypothetical protein